LLPEQTESPSYLPQNSQPGDISSINSPSEGNDSTHLVDLLNPETIPQEVKIESEYVQVPAEPLSSSPAGRSVFGSILGIFKRAKPGLEDSSTKTKELKTSEADSDPALQVLANAKDYNPHPAPEAEVAISSDEIFKEIGQQLRKRRELLSLTYDEIERHTRVRAVFLKSLEEGALEDLPSPVQTRGILANYAAFLDLDADKILLRFADGLQTRYREKRPSQPSRTRAPMTVHTKLPPLRTFIASDLVFGGGMAIMLLLFAVWGIGRVMTVRSSTIPQPTSPSISDILVGTPLPTLPQEVTLIPAQETLQASTPQVTETFVLSTLPADINVQIDLISIESTFMRVVVDGKAQFEGRTVPGTDYTYQAKDQIEVLVGNAAGLKVTYNNKDLGLMGSFGEVIDRVYTAEGVVTPTGSPSPTSTATQKVTGTPSQTLTPTPSVTPTEKPGG